MLKTAKDQNVRFFTSIGGQALIEGIMMRGPDKQAIVIRKPDGELEKTAETLNPIKNRYPILGWPFIRGTVNLISSLSSGIRALTYSAEFMPEDEKEKPSKFDVWAEKKLGSEKAEKLIVAFAVFIGIVFAVGLFFLLPTVLAGLFGGSVENRILRNLIEGVIRITIFVSYIWLCTRIKDIRRVFEYHGAEHKSIFCYEKELPLTVENCRAQPKEHPRCGTSFLFVVMIVSIIVFSLVSWSNVWVRMALRIILLPVVVGITYEINRWAGRHDNLLSSVLAAPGKLMQKLTVYEPDDGMLEVAIAALTMVIPDKKGDDEW